MGDMFTGGFGNVLADPRASAFSQYIAGINQAAQNQERAQNLARGPSVYEKVTKGLFGDQADWADIQKRDVTAKTLGDPLVQQHLTVDPRALATAEQDPHGFAAQAQDPSFRAEMMKAAAIHKAAAANPRITTPDEYDATVDRARDANAHPDVAHVAVAPQKYTVDDFVNTFKGIPTATFMQLFGAQLQHVQTPQEKAATKVFDHMHGVYADANQRVKAMEDEDAALWKEGKSKKYDTYMLPFTGKNPYNTAKEERDKAMKATMDALSQFSGISNKGYVVP
jgi:hypothetical protein